MTMDEVARNLGVSKTTVSRALSGKGRIGKETAERIRQYMRENNVRSRNETAGCIGVAIPADYYVISIPFFQECLLGICSSAATMHYNVLIVADAPDYITRIRSLISKRQIDGFILMRNLQHDPILKYLTDMRFPTALTGRCEYEDVIQVDAENRKPVFSFLSMLMEHSYKRFSVIVGNADYSVNADRINGFYEAAKNCGLNLREQLIYTNILSVDQVVGIVNDCVSKKIECIICGDDVICQWVMFRLLAMGIHIPQDISVVSLFNSVNLENFTPTVTTLSVSSKRMGFVAAQQLINKISGNRYEQKTTIETEILFRQSTNIVPRDNNLN